MPIVARERGRRCEIPTHQPALLALVYLRKYDTPAHIAAGSSTCVGTAHTCTTAVLDLPGDQTPRLPKVPRESDPDYDPAAPRNRHLAGGSRGVIRLARWAGRRSR
ncbi:transposase family protein [Streptomyces kunmingensis]|uniref:Transposase family protein n=1 Tax=Streptomyces kunmingensis TaxID=68225 RepID=A0ABU6CN93_9ACTN|nr:hypothetical protein [Streptomyces kunmingensis]MEB3966153.1 transposase family protein [Streptomyces kunmingensis]